MTIALAGAGPASAAPAIECGDLLTADTTLTHDLVCSGDVGLRLADDVVLDLGGHSVTGSGRGTGIVLARTQDSLVRNGTVANWGTGMAKQWDPFSRIAAGVRDVTFRGNVLGLGSPSTRWGISSSRFIDNESGADFAQADGYIADSTFVGNGTATRVSLFSGLTLIGSTFSGNDVAVDCSDSFLTVTDSAFDGNRQAVTSADCTETAITGSTFTRNRVGYSSGAPRYGTSHSTLSDNRFVGNVSAIGLRADADVTGNVFVANRRALRSYASATAPSVFIRTAGNVFRLNGDALYLSTLGSVGETTAIGNAGYGIYAPRATDLGGNRASLNGRPCVGIAC